MDIRVITAERDVRLKVGSEADVRALATLLPTAEIWVLMVSPAMPNASESPKGSPAEPSGNPG